MYVYVYEFNKLNYIRTYILSYSRVLVDTCSR